MPPASPSRHWPSGFRSKSVERWITQDRMPHAITRARVAKVLGQKRDLLLALPVEHRPSATLSELVQFWPGRSAIPGDVWRSLAGRSERQPPKPPESDKAASPDGRRSNNA